MIMLTVRCAKAWEEYTFIRLIVAFSISVGRHCPISSTTIHHEVLPASRVKKSRNRSILNCIYLKSLFSSIIKVGVYIILFFVITMCTDETRN